MSDDDSGIMAGAAGMSDLQFWGEQRAQGSKLGFRLRVRQP